MTDFRPRPARRSVLAACLASCFALVVAASHAAEDPPNNTNPFSTPGYPANAQRPGTPPGQGANGGVIDPATGMRSLQNSNAGSANGRGRSQGDRNDESARRADQPADRKSVV